MPRSTICAGARGVKPPGLDEETDMADPSDPVADRQIAAASLRTFMRLPPAQRSSVILMDVLGYSLQEIGGVLDTSIARSRRRCTAAARG